MGRIRDTAQSGGRDLSYLTLSHQEDAFFELYDFVMASADNLVKIASQSVFQSELEKLKPNIRRIIDKYFAPALLEISSSRELAQLRDTEQRNLQNIQSKLKLSYHTQGQKKAGKLRGGQGKKILGYLQAFSQKMTTLVDKLHLGSSDTIQPNYNIPQIVKINL